MDSGCAWFCSPVVSCDVGGDLCTVGMWLQFTWFCCDSALIVPLSTVCCCGSTGAVKKHPSADRDRARTVKTKVVTRKESYPQGKGFLYGPS